MQDIGTGSRLPQTCRDHRQAKPKP